MQRRSMPRSRSKERKTLKVLTFEKPKERHRHSRLVECAAFVILLMSIVAIFVRLRKNRVLLPHELRANPIIVAQETPHFHIGKKNHLVTHLVMHD
jgi:hypothetical protein